MAKKQKTPLIIWLLLGASAGLLHAAQEIDLIDPELSKFEVWLGIPHESVIGLPAGTFQSADLKEGQPLGLNNDPKQVFTVGEDGGEPMLCISGEIYGCVSALDEYENYHFSTLFKWGDKKWPPRENRLRDNGILYHCTGEHGAFWKTWKSFIEFQVQETDLGDLYRLAGSGGEVRSSPAVKFKSKAKARKLITSE